MIEPDRSTDVQTVESRPPARWASWLAWGTVASVVPSALWRTAVGLGIDLGWSDDQLRLQRIPGAGTTYVISLSVLSLLAASVTLGLVRPWGERFPAWIPLVGARPAPVALTVVPAVVGAIVVIGICVLSIVNWDQVSGFEDRPRSGWASLMIACYLPSLLWGPLLLAVTWDHWRRRRPVLPRGGSPGER